MTKVASHDSETPALRQQVITAAAFIHHNFQGVKKVFLPKRAMTKKFLPGIFELPGGHIDFGEDIMSGLKREIREELEMEINVGDAFYAFTYGNEVKGSHSIEVIFMVTFKGDVSKVKINPEDHSEYKWFTEDEVEKIVSVNKGDNDPEVKAIRRGFGLLKNVGLNLG